MAHSKDEFGFDAADAARRLAVAKTIARRCFSITSKSKRSMVTVLRVKTKRFARRRVSALRARYSTRCRRARYGSRLLRAAGSSRARQRHGSQSRAGRIARGWQWSLVVASDRRNRDRHGRTTAARVVAAAVREAWRSRSRSQQSRICLSQVRRQAASLLKEVSDLERVVGRISLGSATPRDLCAMLRSLNQVPAIREVLRGLDASLIEVLVENTDELPDMRELITRDQRRSTTQTHRRRHDSRRLLSRTRRVALHQPQRQTIIATLEATERAQWHKQSAHPFQCVRILHRSLESERRARAGEYNAPDARERRTLHHARAARLGKESARR